MHHGINSALSTIIVVLALYGTVDIIVLNIEKLATNFPKYSQNISESLRELEEVVGLEKMDELFAGQSSTIQAGITATAGSFANFLGKFFLILIYLIFIFLEERTIHKKIKKLVSRSKSSSDLLESLKRINDLFHNYVSVKMFTSFLTGVLSFIALLLIGIELPGLWAFIIFLLNFIPTVGSMVATFFPSIFSILQFGDFSHFFLVLVSVGLVQLFIGNFLEPRMMGSRLNISPIVILISLTFWGIIWGIMGMILAVPIMAMLIIVCSQFPSTQGIAIALSMNGEIDLATPSESKGSNAESED
jgi:predicted PurR-regulated permease PerM